MVEESTWLWGTGRNKTADMRQVSFYITKDGRKDLATDAEGFFIEPQGAKGHTW